MNFETVVLIKVVHIYVIKGTNAYTHDIKSICNQNGCKRDSMNHTHLLFNSFYDCFWGIFLDYFWNVFEIFFEKIF
jgi:hypothetical protein